MTSPQKNFNDERTSVFALLCLGCVTISFNVGAITAVLPSIASDLKITDVAASRLIPAYMVPYGLGALMYAPLTRRFSYRWVLGLPLVFYTLASCLCAQGGSWAALVAGRTLMGLTGASVIPMAIILVGMLYEKEYRGRRLGALFSSSFIASVAGIFLSGLAHWRWLFWTPAALGLLTALGIFLSRFAILRRAHPRRVSYIGTLRRREILNVFIFIFIVSMLYHGVYHWFGIFLKRFYGLEQNLISMIFVGLSLGAAVGQISGGIIADKHSRARACRIGLFLLALATTALIKEYPLGILLGIMLLFVFGWTMGHTGISAVLTDFPDRFRPEIASLNSSVRFLAGGLGLYLSGFFVEGHFRLTFFVIGVMMWFLVLLLVRIVPSEKNT